MHAFMFLFSVLNVYILYLVIFLCILDLTSVLLLFFAFFFFNLGKTANDRNDYHKARRQ